jgi:hypothetical protein
VFSHNEAALVSDSPTGFIIAKINRSLNWPKDLKRRNVKETKGAVFSLLSKPFSGALHMGFESNKGAAVY